MTGLFHKNFVLVVVCLVAQAAGFAAPQPGKSILFLNSYHQGYAWSDDILRALRSSLDKEVFPTEMYVEYLDMKRFSGHEHLARFKSQVAAKYGARRFDLIVSSDDDALQFLLDNGDELFGNTPVVFCGVNDGARAARAPSDRYTGVLEDFNSSAVLDLALKLHQEVRRVWIVNDNSPIGIQARNVLLGGRKDREFLSLDGEKLSLDEIVREMANVERDDLVILTAFAHDRTGEYIDRDAAQGRLARASAAPVYSPTISNLGQGIVGANDNAGFEHGLRMARKAIAVLKGTSPSGIRRETHRAAQFVFDGNQLDKYGIAESKLPPGSRFVNGRQSVFQAYRGLIFAVFAAILLEAVIIGLLMLNIRRRQEAEIGLRQKAGELVCVNRDLVEMNKALGTEMAERIKAETRAQRIQEQFWQSQKMEAVGRLAGGIAHDFNNLLTVVGGYGRLILRNEASTDHERAKQIVKATDRAAELTQQLLAFSRKKEIRALPIVINEVIEDTRMMMGQLLGEDIHVVTDFEPGLRAVFADAGQMSQVLMNLAANARDAMPNGGQFTVVTRNLLLEEGQEGLSSGDYVHLAVRDTGVGMPPVSGVNYFYPSATTISPHQRQLQP